MGAYPFRRKYQVAGPLRPSVEEEYPTMCLAQRSCPSYYRQVNGGNFPYARYGKHRPGLPHVQLQEFNQIWYVKKIARKSRRKTIWPKLACGT